MITTLIFDLDGLLADTEKLHFNAYEDVLAELGTSVSAEEYEEHWIRQGKGITEFIVKHDLDIKLDVIRPMKARRYRELVCASAEPMSGAIDALDRLRPHKTIGLATSSYRDGALAILETLGIQDRFECIVTKESAERAKPYPDLFLAAASMLNVEPAECLVLEDAEKGIIAADDAGMLSVAIPNTHTRNNDFSRATAVLPSLDALTIEKIEELGR